MLSIHQSFASTLNCGTRAAPVPPHPLPPADWEKARGAIFSILRKCDASSIMSATRIFRKTLGQFGDLGPITPVDRTHSSNHQHLLTEAIVESNGNLAQMSPLCNPVNVKNANQGQPGAFPVADVAAI